MAKATGGTAKKTSGKARKKTNCKAKQPSEPTKLMMLPLPKGGTVTPKTALAWLRWEFDPFLTVVFNIASEGANPEIRDSAHMLGLDLKQAHKACIRAIETGASQGFERDDDPSEWPDRSRHLALVCASRHVMNHSTGTFEWAFDELAEELARRLGGNVDEATAHA